MHLSPEQNRMRQPEGPAGDFAEETCRLQLIREIAGLTATIRDRGRLLEK